MAKAKATEPEAIRKEQIQEGRQMAKEEQGKAVAEVFATAPFPEESDEIPLPPPGMPGRDGAPEAGPMEVGAGEIPADIYDKVSTKGREPMPAKVFHFRLDTVSGLKSGPKAHYYETMWRCQVEPYTGRPVYCNVMWVSDETLKAAMAGDPEALRKCQDHMREAKIMMTRAKWSGRDLKKFLDSHPEMNLRLRIKEKQSKVGYDKEGNPIYEPSKEFTNEVAEFLPLT